VTGGSSERGETVQAWLNKAWNSLNAGRLEEAVAAAKRVLGYDAGNLQAYWLWAMAAIGLFRHDEAVAVLSEGAGRIAEDSPLKIRFLTQKAHTISVMGWNGEALKTAREALRIIEAHPTMADAETLHFIGASLMRSLNEADALPVLRRASQLDPRRTQTWHLLGEAAEYAGLFDEAEAAFEAAIGAGPNMASHLSLARLRRWSEGRNHIRRLEALLPDTPADEARRGYALFKEYDDLGDTEKAWTWLKNGADAARREPVEPFNPGWSAGQERLQVEAWMSMFPRARFSAVPPPSGPPRRIFVVGMPRSGTTLIERILGAHSQVRPMGELQSFPGAVKLLSGVSGHDLLSADVISSISGVDPGRLAHYYDSDLEYTDDGRCTVDKLPRNADYAGLIRLAFPDAHIVHVRRDPMDTVFGAYKLHFVARWSYDFIDLADHYANHCAVMRHWRACLGEGLIDISLEAVIRDPEAEIRRLLDLCGLPFETACLYPHESPGVVSSASSSQVRKPINADGVGAWRRYEAQLAPLYRRLSDLALLGGI
jgi:tetratricopeptide (TPR) repeat protein